MFLVHILTEMVSVVGQSLKDKISEELIELQGNNLLLNMYLWARMKTLFHKYPRGKIISGRKFERIHNLNFSI